MTKHAPTDHVTLPITLRIDGRAVPQGSKRALRNPHTGRITLVEASKRLKPWRQLVTTIAATARHRPRRPITGPIRVLICFRFQRPPSHLTTTGKPRRSAPEAPTVKSVGDIDKLTRAVLDSFTDAAWWRDDSQITHLRATKQWHDQDEVIVTINRDWNE